MLHRQAMNSQGSPQIGFMKITIFKKIMLYGTPKGQNQINNLGGDT